MTKTNKKKIKAPEIGDFVEIPLENGYHCYARVLKNPLMAFYALRSLDGFNTDSILKSPIAFKIWVMNSAVTSGRWKVVGSAPLEAENEESPWFFKQDAISKKLSFYKEGEERDASLQECIALERASVWSADHVESRLEDYFEGRPNKWVELLRPKK